MECLQAGLDTSEEGKNLLLLPKSEPQVIQPITYLQMEF
jgi:hypothetical protein